jgi:Zn-dependent M28 family amino/carboxypeptidase
MFKGRAMTYYGRWTYKYEIATAKGAAAAIIVHETGPAGYPFEVIMGSSGRENFDLQAADRNTNRVAVEGWVTLDKARMMCTLGGQDFDALKKAALRKDFRPVPFNFKANFTVQNTLREVASRNVIAKVEGADPKLKNEYVIYTAHWDHLGRDPKLAGDQIYNGAVDNASGCAALLELAKAFTQVKPKRTVLFLSVTAEEKGLLGSKYYATHPLHPLERTLADINMDSMNVWGPTRDVIVVGVGQSTLEDTLGSLVRAQGRVLTPEAEPEKGFYFRSDHFEFAKQGVPALYAHAGIDYLGQPKDFGEQKRKDYTEHDYHKVSDKIKPGWNLSGAVEEAGLLFQVGYAVAQGGQWPEWKPGSEFKAHREEMLRRK